LKQIEDRAFCESSLQSIIIPRSVQTIDGSAFTGVILSSFSIESGNVRFVIENGLLIDVIVHKLIHNLEQSSEINIPSSVESLGSCCFSGGEAGSSASLQSIVLPSTVFFIACDAIDTNTEIKLLDGDFCPELDRWRELRRSDFKVDFRRILRVHSGLRCLRDYGVNLSEFEERSMIGESNEISKEIYHRVEDELIVVVKSIALSEFAEKSEMDNKIENLVNLRHPCIGAPIVFDFTN
jgi:hypothetical protein